MGKNRAIFLDRDGVINAALYNPAEGKLDSPYRLEDFRFLPGVRAAIRTINSMGFLAVVVSNQPGVAKGKCEPEFLETLNEIMEGYLALEGAHLDAVYYCLHHPQAVVDSLRQACACRKPRPGLLLQAAEDLSIDLRASYIVGDRDVDVQAGLAAGGRPIQVVGPAPNGERTPLRYIGPHWAAESLPAAVEGIMRLEGREVWTSS
jgi:D-glycero-D-manno-heptose 1,7-bisphosphate phosphatase